MIGARLGNWVIDQELGRGAMGRVYLAHRQAADAEGASPAQGAVKVLAPQLAQEPDFRKRFDREIDALRQLNHPHIVEFYESGSQDGHCFYVMEYVPSQNCAQMLREQGRLPWKEVMHVAVQVCSALKHAHDHGVIHRDIKPHNLLRAADGTIKLADFGVAKVFTSRQLTSTGALIGTAEFASPEQAAGKPVTIRSDLYSLGATLYTLLTGRAPFQGETAVDLLHKHRYAQFERPQRLVPEIPTGLDQIICALLEKDPARRPANALLLQRQIEAVRDALERSERGTVAGGRGPNTNLDFEVPGGVLLRDRTEAPNRDDRGTGWRFPLRGQRWARLAAVLFLLASCGGVAWALWPASAESLFERGAALMESDNPADWDIAWSKYFDRLERRYPGHPYAEQLAGYRQRLDERDAERQALRQTGAAAASDAQLFYLHGRRLRREGDLIGAQLVWQNLIAAFTGVESEQRWVNLAKKALADLRRQLPTPEARLALVRQRLQRIHRPVDQEGDRQLRALEYLYRDDPAVLEEIKKFRG